jgi:hypothetical protein
MTMRTGFLRALIVAAFSAMTLNAVAQTGGTPPTMGSGQTTSSGISQDMKGQMTPDQVRDYLSARNSCGAPSAQTQKCIDDVHKKFTAVPAKCQTLYGPALTDCMESATKRG